MELLIVVMLLAIAATLAVPLVTDTEVTRLRAGARLLVADLGFAQIYSISHADDPCVVIFSQANASYTLARSSTPGTPLTEPVTGRPYVTQFGSGRASEMQGVAIQNYSLGGDDRMVFGMYGQLDQTTPATIALRSGSVTITVQLDPTTGDPTLTGPI